MPRDLLLFPVRKKREAVLLPFPSPWPVLSLASTFQRQKSVPGAMSIATSVAKMTVPLPKQSLPSE